MMSDDSSLDIKDQLELLASVLDADVVTGTVRWYHLEQHGVTYSSVSEIFTDIVFPEAYPYVNNLDEYIDNYLKANESVLAAKDA